MQRLITALLLLASPALAHDAPSNHGGVVADVGPYHVELVAKGQTVDLYLTDDANREVPAAAFKGVAILIVDGKTQRIVMAPATGNRLTGQATTPVSRAPKGAIQLQTSQGATIQGKL